MLSVGIREVFAQVVHQRQVFGKHIFLFDGARRGELAAIGELHKPSVADIFVATMKNGAAA